MPLSGSNTPGRGRGRGRPSAADRLHLAALAEAAADHDDGAAEQAASARPGCVQVEHPVLPAIPSRRGRLGLHGLGQHLKSVWPAITAAMDDTTMDMLKLRAHLHEDYSGHSIWTSASGTAKAASADMPRAGPSRHTQRLACASVLRTVTDLQEFEVLPAIRLVLRYSILFLVPPVLRRAVGFVFCVQVTRNKKHCGCGEPPLPSQVAKSLRPPRFCPSCVPFPPAPTTHKMTHR